MKPISLIRGALAALIVTASGSHVIAQQKSSDPRPKLPTVRCLAFSPDGKSLAVAYANTNVLAIWDVASSQQIYAVRKKSAVQSLAYSPSGECIAIATGNVVQLLDPATGELRLELKGHQKAVRSLSFYFDGKQLATGSSDQTIKLWDCTTGEAVRTFSEVKSPVLCITVSSDGKWLAADFDRDANQQQDQTIKLWNLNDTDQSAPIAEIPTGDGHVPQITLSPDGRLLAIPSYSGTTTLITVPAAQQYLKFVDGSSYCAAFSPDGTWLALVTQEKPVDLLNINPHPTAADAAKIAPLIDQFQDDDYAKRQLASQQLASMATLAIPQLRASLDSNSPEVRIRCRRLVQQYNRQEFATKLTGHEIQPTWVAFSPDSKLLASGDYRGIVKIWNVTTGAEVATLEPQPIPSVN